MSINLYFKNVLFVNGQSNEVGELSFYHHDVNYPLRLFAIMKNQDQYFMRRCMLDAQEQDIGVGRGRITVISSATGVYQLNQNQPAINYDMDIKFIQRKADIFLMCIKNVYPLTIWVYEHQPRSVQQGLANDQIQFKNHHGGGYKMAYDKGPPEEDLEEDGMTFVSVQEFYQANNLKIFFLKIIIRKEGDNNQYIFATKLSVQPTFQRYIWEVASFKKNHLSVCIFQCNKQNSFQGGKGSINVFVFRFTQNQRPEMLEQQAQRKATISAFGNIKILESSFLVYNHDSGYQCNVSGITDNNSDDVHFTFVFGGIFRVQIDERTEAENNHRVFTQFIVGLVNQGVSPNVVRFSLFKPFKEIKMLSVVNQARMIISCIEEHPQIGKGIRFITVALGNEKDSLGFKRKKKTLVQDTQLSIKKVNKKENKIQNALNSFFKGKFSTFKGKK